MEITENKEPRTTEQPKWLDLPEKKEYWTCTGKCVNLTKTPKSERWINLYYSKEDAGHQLPAEFCILRHCSR